jgi:hypothetical protein
MQECSRTSQAGRNAPGEQREAGHIMCPCNAADASRNDALRGVLPYQGDQAYKTHSLSCYLHRTAPASQPWPWPSEVSPAQQKPAGGSARAFLGRPAPWRWAFPPPSSAHMPAMSCMWSCMTMHDRDTPPLGKPPAGMRLNA